MWHCLRVPLRLAMRDLLQAGQRAGRYMAQGLRLMVGQPDYATYLAHMALNHPDTEPMTYEAFFRERQDARFGVGTGRMSRCC
jgi:uncharacterized short protein YbdD (DUF466 family)